MGGEDDLNLIIDIPPLGMMIQGLGLECHLGQEGEGLIEATKRRKMHKEKSLDCSVTVSAARGHILRPLEPLCGQNPS